MRTSLNFLLRVTTILFLNIILFSFSYILANDGIETEKVISTTIQSPQEEGIYKVIISGVKDKAGNETPPTTVGTITVVERTIDNIVNPGESSDVFGSIYKRKEVQSYSSAKVAIYKSGYALEMRDLLAEFGEASILIKPESFSPVLASTCPVLVIPTAALANQMNPTNLRNKLTEYLARGGNLLVMTQPTGACFEILPGNIQSKGYFEDKGYYLATSGFKQRIPALAGQVDANIDGLTDGVISSWPKESDIWLYNIKNNSPLLISYPYGKGRIVISNFFSDYAHCHSLLFEDERNLLRDLLSWGRDFNSSIPEVNLGKSTKVKVPVKYYSSNENQGVEISQVRLVIRDPNRKQIKIVKYPKNLKPGNSIYISYDFDDSNRNLSKNRLGIWWINYELIDKNGKIIQPELEGQRVLLINENLKGLNFNESTELLYNKLTNMLFTNDKLSPISHELKIKASLNKTSYLKGEVAHLSFDIQGLEKRSNFPVIVRVKHGTFDEIKKINLNQLNTLLFQIPIIEFDQKISFGIFNSENGKVLFQDIYNVYEALPEIVVTLPKQRYHAGETMSVNIRVNKEGWLALAGPGDYYRYEKVKDIINYNIPIPKNLRTNTYSLWVSFAGKTVKYNYDVIGENIRFISGKLNQTMVKDTISLDFDSTVMSSCSFNGSVLLELIKPDQTTDLLLSQDFQLTVGESILNYKGEIDSEQTGTYWLRYKIFNGGSLISQNNFCFQHGSEELLSINTNQGEYFNGVESIEGEINLYGKGNGIVTIKVDEKPATEIEVNINGVTTIPYKLEGIPISPGWHSLNAIYQGAGKSGVVATKFNYGTGLPDLRITKLEIGKKRSADDDLPVIVTVKKSNLLPAKDIKVQVLFETGEIARFTIDKLNEDGATFSKEIFWSDDSFYGKGKFRAIVNYDNAVNEYDLNNNTTIAEVVIPAIPQVKGVPYLTNKISQPITGTTTPDALVLLYNEKGGLDFGYADSSGNFSLSAFALSQGKNRLRLKARSREGWETSMSNEFIVFLDSKSPEIRVINIEEGQHFNYNVLPEIQIEEEDIVGVRYWLNGHIWSPNKPIINEGSYQLQIEASDTAGNVSKLTRNFVIDKTEPVVIIDGPKEGQFYNIPQTFKVSVNEQNFGFLEVNLNGEPYQGEAIDQDGFYLVDVLVADKAGNTIVQQLTFTIDRTKPVIHISGVKNEVTYQKSITPIINIDEANPDNILIRLNGKKFQSGTTIRTEGNYTLTVNVIDKAGNQESVSVCFAISSK